MANIQDGATRRTRIPPQLNITATLGSRARDGQPPTPDATPHPDDIHTITATECLENFKRFIEYEKPDLRSFYDDDQLEKLSLNAAEMVNKLREEKCGKETSKHLSILCLYDLVMLVDDSSSMSDEEGGRRIEILAETMKKITMVYDLARPEPDKGLVSVKFINGSTGYKNIDNRRVSPLLKKHIFWGTTQIGSALQRKVLDNFVFNPDAPMKKPLLVMTITDGGPEGESKNHLRNVINNCVGRLEARKLEALELKAQGIWKLGAQDLQPHWGAGKDAVAFHFSRVGNDMGAADLLAELDESCDTVDCLRAEYALQRLSEEGSEWDVLPKLLLGAIIRSINQNDEEESVYNAEELQPMHAETLEDETIEPDGKNSYDIEDD